MSSNNETDSYDISESLLKLTKKIYRSKCQLFYNHLPVPNQYMDFQGLIVMFNEVFMLLIIGGICSNL
jgi:hypothetical protein